MINKIIVIYLGLFFISNTHAATSCIAHAGDTENEYRDSRAAFRSALARGADGIELDIRHTKDKVPLVAHDSNLKDFAINKSGKTCPMTTDISKLNYQIIKDNCLLQNGEEFSTLGSVLEEFKHHNFYLLIDMKDRPTQKTINLINYYYRHSWLKIRSLLKFSSDLTSVFTLRSRLITPCYLTNNKFIPLSDLHYDGVDVASISDGAIKRLHRRKKEISLYDANDYNSLARGFRLGVEFITTDSLSICQQLKQ